MRPLNKAGFTIVETMLFLGISGLLAMGVLVGTGVSINTQRYRDSVTSLRSFFQRQYSEVANVTNSNPAKSCANDEKPVGQSDCVILGKYIRTEDNSTLSSTTVIGTIPVTDPNATDDVGVLGQYHIRVLVADSEKYGLEWGATVVKGNDAMKFSVLILRSPLSGVIRTFIDDSQSIQDSDIGNLLSVTPSALLKPAAICVNSNGLFTGGKLGVNIDANAAGPNGVEPIGDNGGC